MVVLSTLYNKAVNKAQNDSFGGSEIIGAVDRLIKSDFTNAVDYDSYINHCIRLALKQKARYSDIDTAKFYGYFTSAVDRVKTSKKQVYETRESAKLSETLARLTTQRETLARSVDIDDQETAEILREIDREIKAVTIDRASALAVHTRETRESVRVDSYGGFYADLIGENITQIIYSGYYIGATDKVKIYMIIQGGLNAVQNGINKLCNATAKSKNKAGAVICKPIETTASARENSIDIRIDTIDRLKAVASKQQREIMTLKLRGYEKTEIAALLNIPKSAVTIQLQRLLDKYNKV